jgi:hypothetical protein
VELIKTKPAEVIDSTEVAKNQNRGYSMGKVFKDFLIAGMKLKNRIIRSATHEGMGGKSRGSP